MRHAVADPAGRQGSGQERSLMNFLRLIATSVGYLTLIFWTLGKFGLATFIYYFRMG
jgi:hypothetical protein